MSSLVNAARNQEVSTPFLSTKFDIEKSFTPPREMSQLYQRISELESELNTDCLTGIPNRRAFTAYARQLTTSAVVAIVDLDQFKPINDTYGHQVGDRVLCAVAHRLRAAVVGRGIAARLGGDEFAFIIDRSTTDTAHYVLAAALRILAAPLAVGENIFTIAASIGAVHFDITESFPAALHQADIAMYRAKNSGGGVVFYDPAYDTESSQVDVKPQLRIRDRA